MSNRTIGVLIGLAILLAGCTATERRREGIELIASHPVRPSLFDWNPGSNDLKNTKRADTYTLCREWVAWDWNLVINHEEVLETVELDKGEPIGFEVAADGAVAAVFGTRRRALPEANYHWYRRKTSGEVAGEVAAGVGIGLLLIPLAPLGGH
jgi:hypothetical protein